MAAGKKLVAAGLALLAIRLALLAGAGEAVGGLLRDAENGGVSAVSLRLELGVEPSAEITAELAPTPAPTPTPAPQTADDGDIVATTISGGMTISNATDYDIDVAAMLAEGPSLKLSAEGAQILIIHTHSSEAYTSEGFDSYAPSDTGRTEDTRYNIVRVGDELTAALESYGLRVLHDREIYDYPSYTGSYSRSGAAIEAHLAENPSIAVVLDIHRDALSDGDVVYKTVAGLDGECASQVMLLCGTDASGLDHPLWRENLALALYLQRALISQFATLARPVALVKERYNQHLTTGSLILEVGSSGNTLAEALCAARLFADAVAPALLELAE